MYGKHFASMYTGSMLGSGAISFAVWGYVISNMVPDKITGMQVELNPRLLSALIGEDEADIKKIIHKFCQPDTESRTKDEEGRKLVQVGQFDYRVVNGLKYRSVRNAEERREYLRVKQAELRAKKKPTKTNVPESFSNASTAMEREYSRILKEQGKETADKYFDTLRENPPPYQANGI